ncbi:MAG: glutamine synthetase [Actinobacteria bacterium]|nr:glutamine synthetase [Actinomycetota bacterium]MSW98246.1 glutamine synthetase [Actinomycetota bacterium]MTA22627.1 glutamine synthetase [Actinomycetota bacterium]
MEDSVALSLDQLRKEIAEGRIDTVVVGATDMQGRLQGKRIHAPFFLADTLKNGTEGCNYLLAVDIDMNTIQGYAVSSWETGYADMGMSPDLDTLRYLPWQEGSAFVIADFVDHDHVGISVSPRTILKRQLERLDKAGMVALCGTELEFIVFKDTYEEAWDKGYKDLVPANQYNVDYSLGGTARVEKLLREIRVSMDKAGLIVESAKGECNLGQHEIAFRYEDALRTCDNHSVYKMGAKEIASAQGCSLTFMAKFNEREGNSCHIHLSFRDKKDNAVMAGDAGDGMSELGRSFVAGQQAHMRELALLFAPNINSYKRYQAGTFAPTAIKWGRDNRTCALRLVGQGHALRIENRVPGGDVNQYLAVAGMVAAGLDGIEKNLELEPIFTGNAYALETERIPTSLKEARDLWANSTWVTETFGKDVQDHYTHMADTELDAFGRAVTDWERVRSFERM